MNETDFPLLERLIVAHTGLHLRPRERESLRVTVGVRMAALRQQDPGEYRELLESGTRAGELEWEQLTGRLTNNESYFFRDKGQIALLRDRILPELIARNRDRRTLRLWSAGCSTGEEAYSLAILVDELLPRRGAASGSPWEIVILGTDINAIALETARRGIYGDWSFRTMEAEQKQRWFQRAGDGWQLGKESRSLVTFRRCNLVVDPFPGGELGISEMDLILCRNVFIYFAHAAISVVLPKFARTLREGGYLMTGHAETVGRSVEPLAVRQFPESVVYHRESQASTKVNRPVSVPHRPLTGPLQTVAALVPAPAMVMRPRELPRGNVIATAPPTLGRAAVQVVEGDRALEVRDVAEAEARYAAGDYLGTVRMLESLPEPVGEKALLLRAHALANLGHAKEVTECCRRLTDAFPFAAEPYELLAFLAQEQGRYEDAKLLLKQAVYLDPGLPGPYLELADLYDREGDAGRAHKMRATALELLLQLPPETKVGFSGRPTAEEWKLHLQQRLSEGA